jgi:hypothetical protein
LILMNREARSTAGALSIQNEQVRKNHVLPHFILKEDIYGYHSSSG